MIKCGWLLLLLSVTAPAQHQQDVIDQAHRGLFQTPPDKKKSASAITAEVSRSLPSTPSRPVAQRNFIDSYVFARMQRERIPHAALAPDEEFARRAWLDATGRIPSYDELTAFLG